MSNYELKKLLYKVAGYDEVIHWLMNELDKTEKAQHSETNTLRYLELKVKADTLRQVRDVYCSVKRTGKLPEEIQRIIEMEDNLEDDYISADNSSTCK